MLPLPCCCRSPQPVARETEPPSPMAEAPDTAGRRPWHRLARPSARARRHPRLFLKQEVTMIISTRRVLLPLVCTIMLSGCEGLLVTDTQSLLAPTFTRSEILGLIAGFGTTFAALPDLISMLRRRSSAGMNPKMAAIMGVFQILWIWYGLLIVSRPVVALECDCRGDELFCRGSVSLLCAPRTRKIGDDGALIARAARCITGDAAEGMGTLELRPAVGAEELRRRATGADESCHSQRNPGVDLLPDALHVVEALVSRGGSTTSRPSGRAPSRRP